ncbi:CRISPR-associated protein Cas2 [Schleiferia thermophila str. Yellowstone]|jgi:CRISPR-associated protein Cas2|uniref:CRISPR-associated endonuclease Cas2 n=1 Tax=Schleiferia thermophila TaxID=884107 RepID=UPI0004E78A79|nr:CRISPR-associated endonuclease Cas2 [Schleiferia thermophila]KFD38276.1 CRISPR-associated protein Cas2 [Schleiferia thermophila str. Yellowstone]
MKTRLNAYRIMWLFVYFDLPTQTKQDKKAYAQFRKELLFDGFMMIQYSIYARHCASRENLEVHKKRVKSVIPEKGNVILFEITDKQFGMMEFYTGKTKPKKTPDQRVIQLELELF